MAIFATLQYFFYVETNARARMYFCNIHVLFSLDIYWFANGFNEYDGFIDFWTCSGNTLHDLSLGYLELLGDWLSKRDFFDIAYSSGLNLGAK